jgi:hypothetical protein
VGLKVNITSDGGHTRDEILEARGYKIPIRQAPTVISSEHIIAEERAEVERLAREGRL